MPRVMILGCQSYTQTHTGAAIVLHGYIVINIADSKFTTVVYTIILFNFNISVWTCIVRECSVIYYNLPTK